ncbi:T9SS type A sorting domain-containing protein [Psychroserpens sp. Hel_I_66]|uniref:T9SS type A sorting domain-containing protein n=1 Tax=Psychroserpens sp. Hel_I_66 TaxID=1250004 RepID=UPI00064910FC|nr:T9SS type A sorting domain-containing protein [Psychroserpens sp. Hel_I_66]
MKKLLPTFVFFSVLIGFNNVSSQEKQKTNFEQKIVLDDSNPSESTQRLVPINYIYDDGWIPSNPIGEVNSIDSIFLESGTVHISANTVCEALVVNPGATVIIDENITLTTVSVDLYSTSSLYSSLVSDGTIIGTVNYHRYTSQIGINDLISSPLSGDVFGDFEQLNIGKLAASGDLRAFAPFMTSAGSYQNYDIITNAATGIESGIGYRAATIDGIALTFTGTVRTDDVLDIPISDATAGGSWNLIGNPYPSYIDFNAFFALNKSQLDGGSYQSIYGYNGDPTSGWTVWNQATLDSPIETEMIAPGQGFFVKAKSGGGLIDFTTSMRCEGGTDDFILGRSETTSPHYGFIKLGIESDSQTFNTDFYFNSNATTGFDPGYDSGLYNQNPTALSISSRLVENDQGMLFGIQSLNPDAMYDIEVPLNVTADQGQQITFSILNTDMPETIDIYLDDLINNTSTLLTNSDHVFTPTTDISGTGQFLVRFSSNALSDKNPTLDAVNIFSDTTNKTIVITGQIENHTKANVFDVNGRMITSHNLSSNLDRNIIAVSQLSAGIYILELEDNSNTRRTQKLVIR